MKAVLKSLLLPIALIVLFTQCEKETEIHPEDPIDIPDDAFLTALIEEGVDTNGDGLISYAEAEVIISLDVNYEYISNLSGIEAFENLDSLYCSKNLLTYLDISGCAALRVLHCDRNQLTSLDVSNNTALTQLYCFGNPFSSLDVSNNTALTDLNCFGNQLTSLDLSNNTALTRLGCADNQLTSLDLSNNTALTRLGCGDNQLTSLDISKNTALGWLYLEDVPSLYEVCVWTIPFPPDGIVVFTTDSPNVYFTTDCSK